MCCCGTGHNILRQYIYPHIPTAHFPNTMSVTHPTTRTQDISTSSPFSAGTDGSPTQGSLLFLLHSSIPLKQDACSPVAQISQHICLLQVYVEMTQDVTVKKKSCGPAQLYTN
jgi:hypothetical protein